MIIKQNQTLLDVALNGSGTLEALFDVAAARNVSITDIPTVGDNYIIPTVVQDLAVLKYLGANEIIIATLAPGGIGKGIGSGDLEGTFIIG